jgi:hypothetical protein
MVYAPLFSVPLAPYSDRSIARWLLICFSLNMITVCSLLPPPPSLLLLSSYYVQRKGKEREERYMALLLLPSILYTCPISIPNVFYTLPFSLSLSISLSSPFQLPPLSRSFYVAPPAFLPILFLCPSSPLRHAQAFSLVHISVTALRRILQCVSSSFGTCVIASKR